MKHLSEKRLVRLPGIEPGSSAWEAEIIPLDHSRVGNTIDAPPFNKT